nr:hypothetical protein [uncultured Ralstonia sp.]
MIDLGLVGRGLRRKYESLRALLVGHELFDVNMLAMWIILYAQIAMRDPIAAAVGPLKDLVAFPSAFLASASYLKTFPGQRIVLRGIDKE